jgi:hypothetical protein
MPVLKEYREEKEWKYTSKLIIRDTHVCITLNMSKCNITVTAMKNKIKIQGQSFCSSSQIGSKIYKDEQNLYHRLT